MNTSDRSRRASTILKRATILFLCALVFSAPSVRAQNKSRTTLDVYVIDVEGGNATLFVSPSGESLLMDTGNVAPGAVRDASRIMAAIHDAGLHQIDHLIITHWHGDHFGGLAELAPQIPIREFIDHGPNMQPAPARRRVRAENLSARSSPAAKAKHTVAKPGDHIRMGGVDVLVVTSAGQVIKTPVKGGGKPNPYCSGIQVRRSQRRGPAIHRHLHHLR